MAIRQRPGVQSVAIVGRDGLLIDTTHDSSVDSERVAAAIPDILAAASSLGELAGAGGITDALVEYTGGSAIVTVLDHDAVLVILAANRSAGATIAAEVQRNRADISALFQAT